MTSRTGVTAQLCLFVQAVSHHRLNRGSLWGLPTTVPMKSCLSREMFGSAVVTSSDLKRLIETPSIFVPARSLSADA